jgi:hypothetical protein
MRLEGLGKLKKNAFTLSGFETATIRLVEGSIHNGYTR